MSKNLLWFFFLSLLLFGHGMIFSSTAVLGLERHGSEFYYLLRHTLTTAVALLAMIAVSRIPISVWWKWAVPLFVAQIVLVLLTHIPGLSLTAAGASRWLNLKLFVFQPTELAKITFPLFVSKMLAKQLERPRDLKFWGLHALLILILLALVFKQPDLGTTFLLATCFLSLLFLAGIRPIYLLLGMSVGALFLFFAMVHSDYRKRRLMAFLNPWSDPQGSGFQTIQSFLSFHSGKIFGVGIGNGNSKLFFLPEVHTDFIYALIGEELGFLGAVIILILFALLIYQCFSLSLLSQTKFGSLFGAGIALILCFQVIMNLGGVTGIIPMKGLPLPFFSWGRTSHVVHLLMIGLLLGISREKRSERLASALK